MNPIVKPLRLSAVDRFLDLHQAHGYVIPVLYALVLVPPFIFHTTFEEWDGVMQCFAGREILGGSGYIGWTSHFWPPLYSLLIGIGEEFAPGFEAAKSISMISGVILLFVAYIVSIELTGERRIGLLTQLFLALNPLYFISSFQAENHMLDSMFFITALLFLLKFLRNPTTFNSFVTGILCAFAGLSRYTSYALIPISFLAPFVFLRPRKAIPSVFSMAIGFMIVSSP